MEVKKLPIEGKTVLDVQVLKNDVIIFHIVDDQEQKFCFEMYHRRDCCESVHIHDIVGDLKDLIGQKIVLAEERVDTSETIEPPIDRDYVESFTWTFYEIRCNAASVTISWFGDQTDIIVYTLFRSVD